MKEIILKILDIDVSNSCWNVCQWCYHNKIINTKLTSIFNFELYLSNLFNFIDNKKIDSLALYWWNLLEKKENNLYIDKILEKKNNIKSYLYSTSFGLYNNIAKSNLLYILKKFKNTDFIFQFFYNYEHKEEYLKCLQDILKLWNLQTVFFAVQLYDLNKNNIYETILSIKNIFLDLWYKEESFFDKLEIYFNKAINLRIRTEDFYIKINWLKILFLVVYPVNKTWKKITSVVWDNCSFYNSTKITNDYIELWMLSIEYDWYVNFHNPNCIASLQRIFHINDWNKLIYKKLLLFYIFLLNNEKNYKSLLDKCNNCLKFNLNNKWICEKK